MAIPPFDPRDPGFRIRPDFHELTARLRAEAPVHEVDAGLKAVSRHADIREISRDPQRFVNGQGVLVNDPIRDGRSIQGSILHMDPPQHGEWRRLLNRRFTPRAVTPLVERIRTMTVDLLEAIPRGEPVDLVAHLCAPLPVLVIAELLGIGEGDRKDFERWSDAAIAATDGMSEISPEDLAAMGELGAFLHEHAAAKAVDPGDDLVSALLGSEVDGRPLDPPELMMFSLTLLVAGNETTRHLLSGALIALAEHPDQRAALADDPAGVTAAVEECLRWVTPIHQFARTVVEDTTVGGVPVEAGDYLVMLYASGNRDEDAFGPTADRFDAFRQPSVPNLGFGFGEHLCLGAALARLEGRVVLEEVLGRHPTYELTQEPVIAPSSLVHGPHELRAVL
ncbi:MAG TPA: cytochrome P450 [Acidimicrobiales bacterium]|nr:cytochrome P450 [Acidimicrobiales bacterium]